MGSKLQTHCKRGHEFNAENTYFMPKEPPQCIERVCLICKKIRAKDWHEKNKLQHRRSMRENMYGVGAWQHYKDQLEKQDHRCAICNTHQSELVHALAQDHDHTTGELRGLLCGFCNRAIGNLKENPVTIASALDYVLNWKNKTSEVTLCQPQSISAELPIRSSKSGRVRTEPGQFSRMPARLRTRLTTLR